MEVEPETRFAGTVLIAVPHMDDCALACGCLMARLPRKERLHVVYATDGRRSPAPLLPWRDRPTSDLGQVRVVEAREALALLGIPQANITFLGLPDGRLKQHQESLRQALLALVARIEPQFLFMPFRYDQHPDHLALNHALTAAHRAGQLRAQLWEYFVYYRWRLLPGQDVRDFIRPECLLAVQPDGAAALKRQALACFKSQTTLFYPWQSRPNLTPKVLDQASQTPELFLALDPAMPGAAIFTARATRIRLAHRLEPFLKRGKDQALAVWRRSFSRHESLSN